LDKVKRHFDNVIDINVILSVDKLKQLAEASVHVSGKTIFAETEDSNLYVAIDSLIDSLDRQILKHKEKNNARRHDDSGKHAAAE
ncbi:MAG TPA: ribosome-associated translation inhibitor RaiA, partial [Gallionellaceae bacterium]|nr:ribosome-associated translation inhibitor RaiA [Gallionellaceae bacterium]